MFDAVCIYITVTNVWVPVIVSLKCLKQSSIWLLVLGSLLVYPSTPFFPQEEQTVPPNFKCRLMKEGESTAILYDFKRSPHINPAVTGPHIL